MSLELFQVIKTVKNKLSLLFKASIFNLQKLLFTMFDGVLFVTFETYLTFGQSHYLAIFSAICVWRTKRDCKDSHNCFLAPITTIRIHYSVFLASRREVSFPRFTYSASVNRLKSENEKGFLVFQPARKWKSSHVGRLRR